jgi:hypothetical protein
MANRAHGRPDARILTNSATGRLAATAPNPAKIDDPLKFRAVSADTTDIKRSPSARNRQRLCIGVEKT